MNTILDVTTLEGVTAHVIDRHDAAARVERYDAVCQAGCEHIAVTWNAPQVVLYSCPCCRDDRSAGVPPGSPDAREVVSRAWR
jgi:hypothetical protein